MQALVHEGLAAGEDWAGSAGSLKCMYEDDENEQVMITSKSSLRDVRRHAQKLHVFQRTPKSTGGGTGREDVVSSGGDTAVEDTDVAHSIPHVTAAADSHTIEAVEMQVIALAEE